MNKKAVIFDLDNTIYPVSSIADKVFPPLFQLIENSRELDHCLEQVKDELMQRPFQAVAGKYGFSEALTQEGIRWLKNLTYEGPVEPYPDYHFVKTLSVQKYLVTTGFPKLQQSKIQKMGLEKDFNEIHVVDPEKTSKREVFADILQRNSFHAADVLVVGDDLESEIRAAQELGVVAILYDRMNLHVEVTTVPRISNYKQLASYLA